MLERPNRAMETKRTEGREVTSWREDSIPINIVFDGRSWHSDCFFPFIVSR